MKIQKPKQQLDEGAPFAPLEEIAQPAPDSFQRDEEQQAAKAARPQQLQDNPFDPRTEVSADARYIASRIVKHMWILFVLLPLGLGILLIIVSAMK